MTPFAGAMRRTFPRSAFGAASWTGSSARRASPRGFSPSNFRWLPSTPPVAIAPTSSFGVLHRKRREA